MTDGHSLVVPVNGLSTHAWVRGQGQPVVIVPGLGCASWMYARLARELARERRVFAYDPPGHGYSEGARHYPVCISHLTDHLAAWLTRLKRRPRRCRPWCSCPDWPARPSCRNWATACCRITS